MDIDFNDKFRGSNQFGHDQKVSESEKRLANKNVASKATGFFCICSLFVNKNRNDVNRR